VLKQDFQPTTYIVTNRKYDALYTGVTSNLIQRIHQHREKTFSGFAASTGANRLVWFEQLGTMELAIQREKRIKKWNRPWKIELIEAMNPHWRDLAIDLGFPPLPPRPS
jgi:putative endonuclease